MAASLRSVRVKSDCKPRESSSASFASIVADDFIDFLGKVVALLLGYQVV